MFPFRRQWGWKADGDGAKCTALEGRALLVHTRWLSLHSTGFSQCGKNGHFSAWLPLLCPHQENADTMCMSLWPL